MRRSLGRFCWVLVLPTAWLWPLGPAAAQGPDQSPDRKPRTGRRPEKADGAPGQQPDHPGRGPGHGPHSRPFGGGGPGPGFGPQLLHPAPEDLGPLAPGEEEELLTFAQEHMPRFYDAMQRLRQREPDRFRARLEENAPRLRRLRRIYENNPRLAEIIQTHAENMFTIHRRLRQLRPAASDPAQYEATLQAVRALITENVRLETEALELLATELEARREQRIAEHVARLLDAGNDLADEPEGLRELALAARSAVEGPQGEEASARLRQAIAQRVAGEIEALRQRSVQMRENAGEEVDSRLKALLSPPGLGEERPTGPRPGRGR